MGAVQKWLRWIAKNKKFQKHSGSPVPLRYWPKKPKGASEIRAVHPWVRACSSIFDPHSNRGTIDCWEVTNHQSNRFVVGCFRWASWMDVVSDFGCVISMVLSWLVDLVRLSGCGRDVYEVSVVWEVSESFNQQIDSLVWMCSSGMVCVWVSHIRILEVWYICWCLNW